MKKNLSQLTVKSLNNSARIQGGMKRFEELKTLVDGGGND